jgi:hypothetical protein
MKKPRQAEPAGFFVFVDKTIMRDRNGLHSLL